MARSTCAPCERVFSGLTSFDAHHKSEIVTGPLGQRLKITCLDPTDVGLVQRENGVWAHPTPDEKPSHFASAKGQEPKTYSCACGNKFKGTGKRGRPPKTCTDCGGKGIVV